VLVKASVLVLAGGGSCMLVLASGGFCVLACVFACVLAVEVAAGDPVVASGGCVLACLPMEVACVLTCVLACLPVEVARGEEGAADSARW